MKYIFILAVLFCASVEFFASTTSAAAILNPDSRHAQYMTYGLYFEPQSMLLVKSGGNAWGEVGGYAPLVEFAGAKYSPQLILHATANCSYRLDSKGSGEVMTKFETVDARVGLAYDMRVRNDLRAMVNWTHYSGHISDNVSDLSLIGPDVGNEVIDFRVIKDYGKTWRVGAGFRPTIHSHPTMHWFGGEEFVEYFPYETAIDSHHLKPFIAAGLEQYGNHTPELTAHVQAGFTTGDHFAEKSERSMRFVVGAYSGQDPRLKYLQYFHETAHFIYGGIVIDL